jgi:hypothetical protein
MSRAERDPSVSSTWRLRRSPTAKAASITHSISVREGLGTSVLLRCNEVRQQHTGGARNLFERWTVL